MSEAIKQLIDLAQKCVDCLAECESNPFTGEIEDPEVARQVREEQHIIDRAYREAVGIKPWQERATENETDNVLMRYLERERNS